jgi:hypothetical protein
MKFCILLLKQKYIKFPTRLHNYTLTGYPHPVRVFIKNLFIFKLSIISRYGN